MVQAKFSLEENQIEFLKHYKRFGFKDRSALIRSALDRLIKELAHQALKNSAELYTQIYEEDQENRELTESALSGWPE